MSTLNFKDGRFFLQDGDKNELLLDVVNWSANRSRVHSTKLKDLNGTLEFPLMQAVNRLSKKIFRNTPESLAEVVIFLRTIARLLVKPQIHHVLRIGNWSPLDDALAEMLPQFNPANKLYCLSTTRPLGKVPSTVFLCAEGGQFPLPENKFDTVISIGFLPTAEVFLSAVNFGKIYFAASPDRLPDSLRPTTKTFTLTEKAALFEVELTPALRREIFRRTPQGQLDAQKFFIKQTVANFLPTAKKFNVSTSRADKNFLLDKYIAELTRAEKVLAEIFPSLHTDTVKFNFNLFKEFLLDVRLVPDANAQKISSARAVKQHEILTQDLNNA